MRIDERQRGCVGHRDDVDEHAGGVAAQFAIESTVVEACVARGVGGGYETQMAGGDVVRRHRLANRDGNPGGAAVDLQGTVRRQRGEHDRQRGAVDVADAESVISHNV